MSLSIALFSEYYLPHYGGIEGHVHNLARQLMRAGHDVTVITPYPGERVIDGVRIERQVVPLLPKWHTVFTPAGYGALEELLRTRGFDVLHCHYSVYSPATACATYIGQRLGLPTVVTFHSFMAGYTGMFTLLDRVTHWSQWPVHYTAVSDYIARQLQPVLGRVPRVLPNAIDHAAWPPQPHTPAPGEFRVLSSMRLARRKRPRALIEMLALLRDRMPTGTQLRARIFGAGAERPALERLITETGLSGVVELKGRVSHEQMLYEYAHGDVFVLPSLEESFGIAALEARAVGLPVVAFEDSGPAGFISHGLNGLLASSDADMVACLMRLAHDFRLRERIAAHNRNHPPPYSWEQVTQAHLALYGESVGGVRHV